MTPEQSYETIMSAVYTIIDSENDYANTQTPITEECLTDIHHCLISALDLEEDHHIGSV